MNVISHERLSDITPRHELKVQFAVINDMIRDYPTLH